MKKKNIAIITGGYSSERKISLSSAENFINILNMIEFDFYLIDIQKKNWLALKKNNKPLPKRMKVDKNDFTIQIHTKKIVFHLVVPIIHGTPVEDGKLLAYFDLLNIPYLGTKYFQSALTFNKFYTNLILKDKGINVANSVLLYSSMSRRKRLDTIKQHISFPFFIKPNNGGSSYGTFLVEDTKQFHSKINTSFQYDKEVICEEYIQGKEFTIGVYKLNNKVKALPITEIKSENIFFDFDAKYKGKSKEITPAKILQKNKKEITELAKDIYSKLSLDAIVRMDFILSKKQKQMFFLEVNTNPGMTPQSIIPQQIFVDNKKISTLYSQLINEILTK